MCEFKTIVQPQRNRQYWCARPYHIYNDPEFNNSLPRTNQTQKHFRTSPIRIESSKIEELLLTVGNRFIVRSYFGFISKCSGCALKLAFSVKVIHNNFVPSTERQK